MDETQFPKIDRTAFSVVSSFEEADRQDKEYWLSRTPHERLQYIELLRRVNYGSVAATRLQRVLEIVEFEQCYQSRIVDQLDGIQVNLIDLENLKKNKKASGRTKDLADLENLA